MTGVSKRNLTARLSGILVLTFLLGIALPTIAGAQHSLPAAQITDEQAEQNLREGNSRFVSQEMKFPNQDHARLAELVAGQHPYAVVVTCSDSRVPAELLFDAGLGELFVVRVAGNVADVDEIASVEYAVEHLGVPLVMVLGHSDCGSVETAIEGKKQPRFIAELTDNIESAVVRAKRRMSGLPSDDGTLLSCTTQENVWRSIEDLITRSPEIYARAMDGRLKLIGGVYNVASGKVQWMGTHPRQQSLDLADEAPTKSVSKNNARNITSSLAKMATLTHPEGISSDLAQMLLREGNKRFVAGTRNHPNLNPSRMEEVSSNQHPYAVILSCSDSRVAPEHIFDAGLGDLFVVRVAGNVADVDEIGSIEYGACQLHVPLLVVMGHTGCGAVTAVMNQTALEGNLAELTDNIKPAAAAARSELPGASSEEVLNAAIKNNVWQSVSDLLAQSSDLRLLVEKGYLQIVGALYHLDDGYVEWLGPHPGQKQILAKHSRAAKSNTQQNDSGYESSQNAYENGESEN